MWCVRKTYCDKSIIFSKICMHCLGIQYLYIVCTSLIFSVVIPVATNFLINSLWSGVCFDVTALQDLETLSLELSGLRQTDSSSSVVHHLPA